jgi:feruloyl esterase
VTGIIEGAIQFEVSLPPADKWNGKINGTGAGGAAGYISADDLNENLSLGYATAANDTGHVGAKPSPWFDISWALDPSSGKFNVDAIKNFGYRSTHLMTVAAKDIIKAYYNHPPMHSYFTGCSTGGRMALSEAQRYPQDYDGIVAGAPANYYMNMWPGEFYPSTLVRGMDVKALIGKLDMIQKAAVAQCDGLDGKVDGLIDDPRVCPFDARSLLCAQGQDTAQCLTEQQAKVVNLIYKGLRDPYTGEQIWPGYEPGSESEWAGHLNSPPLQVGFVKYMIFKDPNADASTFNFSDLRDYTAMNKTRELMHPIMDATDPDISDFTRHGGKLLMYHGWADPNIAPTNAINYYESAKQAIGTEAHDSVRLFMVPGMGHCTGGAGFHSIDYLGALEKWVEAGVRPDQLLGTNPTSGKSRPICAYPKVAKFRWGSLDDPAAFVCE